MVEAKILENAAAGRGPRDVRPLDSQMVEQGGRVLLLDKSAYLGGNSTKATSGINGALTSTQVANGIKDDSREVFYQDAAKSAAAGLRAPLVKVLTYGSAPAVEWLQEVFGIDLSKVAMMGGHSYERCHRGKERFPGAAITMLPPALSIAETAALDAPVTSNCILALMSPFARTRTPSRNVLTIPASCRDFSVIGADGSSLPASISCCSRPRLTTR